MFHKGIKTTIEIEGMYCQHCANKVKKALEMINGVDKVIISLKKKRTVVISKQYIDKEQIKEVIDNLGYKVFYMD